MRFTLTAISILTVLALSSCGEKGQESQEQQAQQQMQTPPQMMIAAGGPDLHTAEVQEVVQATSYTYLNVKEGDRAYWMAIAKKDIKAGETVSFAGGLEMNNFESKELQRTFESIYFVDRLLSDEPAAMAGEPSMSAPHQMKPLVDKQEVAIEPAEGGITIAELFGNRNSYGDKTVLIKGKVTKVNRAIMDRNWVHLQDGTGDADNYDLTITTNEDVNVGEVVTFEGKITLNKDFGSGYSYEVIMEEAKRKTE
ncbi:MAG: hypothetical protein ABIF19_10935 [Planctomycetota bacterium]